MNISSIRSSVTIHNVQPEWGWSLQNNINLIESDCILYNAHTKHVHGASQHGCCRDMNAANVSKCQPTNMYPQKYRSPHVRDNFWMATIEMFAK